MQHKSHAKDDRAKGRGKKITFNGAANRGNYELERMFPPPTSNSDGSRE